MSIMEIPSLNRDITNEHISMPYPHIMLHNPTDALAVVLESIDNGDLPILCEYKGSCRQLAAVRKSALVINTLSKVCNLSYVKAPSESVPIQSVYDILEVL